MLTKRKMRVKGCNFVYGYRKGTQEIGMEGSQNYGLGGPYSTKDYIVFGGLYWDPPPSI